VQSHPGRRAREDAMSISGHTRSVFEPYNML
jgi:hypothetical protein